MARQDQGKLCQSIPVESLKLTNRELTRLLDEMGRVPTSAGSERRQHERHECRCSAIVVTVDQNGSQFTFVVPVRNISKGGVAFLHRAMIHLGSRCLIRIRCATGKWLGTHGKIVRSRYVRTGVYEIGVQFDIEIDVAPFVVSKQASGTNRAAQPKSAANPPAPHHPPA